MLVLCSNADSVADKIIYCVLEIKPYNSTVVGMVNTLYSTLHAGAMKPASTVHLKRYVKLL